MSQPSVSQLRKRQRSSRSAHTLPSPRTRELEGSEAHLVLYGSKYKNHNIDYQYVSRLRACGAVSDRDRALGPLVDAAVQQAPAEDASRPPRSRVAAGAARDALQACRTDGGLRGVKIARGIHVP